MKITLRNTRSPEAIQTSNLFITVLSENTENQGSLYRRHQKGYQRYIDVLNAFCCEILLLVIIICMNE